MLGCGPVILQSNGSNLKMVTKGRSASWHPSGGKIVFVKELYNKFPIFEIDATGNNLKLIYDGNPKQFIK